MKNFALTGAAGFVAPRHMRAIRDTGHRLLAAVDPSDSVGALDQHGLDVAFFTEIERFDRHLEKLRRGPREGRIDYVSVCSPNFLHDAHCRLGLRIKADVICEKPVVINPWNLDALEDLEAESGRRIWTILHLRTHDRLAALREEIQAEPSRTRHDVVLTYVTPRGRWYDTSWKGQPDKSGGLASNIGIHFFDLLLWMFGAVEGARVHRNDPRRMSGFLELERARIRWFLSVEADDLPRHARGNNAPFRSIAVDGTEIEFSDGFEDLHTRIYARTLAGQGFGIPDARPSIELAHRLRSAALSPPTSDLHPYLER
ncbi:UDP-N-acetyl-2-amino-2-deoxy-D-glucuronate oxidase [soil metagenome]